MLFFSAKRTPRFERGLKLNVPVRDRYMNLVVFHSFLDAIISDHHGHCSCAIDRLMAKEFCARGGCLFFVTYTMHTLNKTYKSILNDRYFYFILTAVKPAMKKSFCIQLQ